MPYEDFDPILKKLRSSSFDGTMISGLNEILLLNQKNKYNFTFNFCKERIAGISIVMYFRKNFFLIPAVNKIIRNLVAGGIIERLHKKYLDEELLSVKNSLSGPKVLKLDHLDGAFQILAIGSIFSFILFLAELVVGYKKFCQQKLK